MNIYNKITKFRDEHQNSPDYEIKENFLEQLLILSFTNKANPDFLPDVFVVHHIFLSEEQVVEIMSELSFNVTVETVLTCILSKFYSFKITIIK